MVKKKNSIYFDDVPTEGSSNAITSGAVKKALDNYMPSGASDYTDLSNKPSINSITLSGNKTTSDLSLASASDMTTAQADITDIKAVIPSNASSSNKLVTVADVPSGGASDYTDLTNKPSINSITLSGNKTTSDLSLASASDMTTAQADITDIKAVIPSNASSSNKLVTVADVPSGGSQSIFDILAQYKNTVSTSTTYTRLILWFKNFLDQDVSDQELHIRVPGTLVKTMGDIPTEFSDVDNIEYLYLHFYKVTSDSRVVLYKGVWTVNLAGHIKVGTINATLIYNLPTTVSSSDFIIYRYLNSANNLTNRTA